MRQGDGPSLLLREEQRGPTALISAVWRSRMMKQGTMPLSFRGARLADSPGAGNNGKEVATMIAAISMIRRLDNVTLGGFRRHWLDVHGPLVCTFDGLRSYMQCHPIESPAMNARARSLRIDGFPILFFDNHAERAKTKGSPALAALDVDSTLFIGAVARLATNVEVLVPEVASPGRVSTLLLYPDPADAGQVDADADRLRALRSVQALLRYHVRGQGAAVNSTVPHLPISAGAVLQARFASLVDLECAMEEWEPTHVARFVVEEHRLV